MATVTLTVTPPAPARGETITAEYTVTGNDGTEAGPPVATEVAGDVTIGDQTLHVATVITLPGTPSVPPLPETFSTPTADGLTFKATSDPRKFTAVVPG